MPLQVCAPPRFAPRLDRRAGSLVAVDGLRRLEANGLEAALGCFSARHRRGAPRSIEAAVVFPSEGPSFWAGAADGPAQIMTLLAHVLPIDVEMLKQIQE